MVQETVHSSKESSEHGMVIKLDMANSFDKARHAFLFTFMEKLGFDTLFLNWIKACINAP